MSDKKSAIQVSRRRRRVITGTVSAAVAVGLLCTAGACGSSGGVTSSQGAVNSSNATAQTEYNEFNAAVKYPFADSAPSDPLERKNLAARLVQYNSKGDTNYVYIFAGMTSTVIGYYVINGKVSSTSSEMTSTNQITNCGTANNGDYGGCSVSEAIGDDGSYGPEEGGQNGVFFFTVSGNLVETDQLFLVSSIPLKIYSSVPQLDAAAK